MLKLPCQDNLLQANMIVTIKDYTIVTRATLDITGFLFLIFAITACINYCNLTFYNILSDDEEKPRKLINIYKALVYNNINIGASVIFVCVGTCFIDPEFFLKIFIELNIFIIHTNIIYCIIIARHGLMTYENRFIHYYKTDDVLKITATVAIPIGLFLIAAHRLETKHRTLLSNYVFVCETAAVLYVVSCFIIRNGDSSMLYRKDNNNNNKAVECDPKANVIKMEIGNENEIDLDTKSKSKLILFSFITFLSWFGIYLLLLFYFEEESYKRFDTVVRRFTLPCVYSAFIPYIFHLMAFC